MVVVGGGVESKFSDRHWPRPSRTKIDKSEKSPESEALVNDDINVETIKTSDEQPSPRKEPPTAIEKSAANVEETIAEEPSSNILE